MMKALSLQITYRKGKPIAAYIYLPRKRGDKATRTDEPTPGLLVDFAADDRPIGIEIRSPGYVGIEQIQRVFEGLGLGRASEEELAPLRAA
jgi:hypothetical protein